jgi:lycopene beta-cyclase
VTQRHYDIIFVGGGLANCLAAYRLQQIQPGVRMLMIEAQQRLCGDRTWSFHQSDLRCNHVEDALSWLNAFSPSSWPGYQVCFQNLQRRLDGSYLSVEAANVRDVLSSMPSLDILYNESAQFCAESGGVTLKDGRFFASKLIVRATGAAVDADYKGGYQKFLGLKLRLTCDHGLTEPIIMDTRIDQFGSFRFVYVLPYNAKELLVEDTYYSTYPEFSEADLQERIESYVAERGWQIESILYREKGCLPIPMAPDSQKPNLENFSQYNPKTDTLSISSGMAAGFFHPTTGYSIPEAIRFAEWLSVQFSRSKKQVYAASKLYYVDFFKRLMFYWRINNMLFCSGEPDQRHLILEGFYTLPEKTIQRFYALRFTATDFARLMFIGCKLVPLYEGLKAFYRQAEVKHDYHDNRLTESI